MTEEKLLSLWEWRTIHTTKNWIIREITTEEWIQLFKQEHFFTEWLDFVIFDEDKYTVKWIIKFILEKEELQEKTSFMWLYITAIVIFTIIIAIVWVSMNTNKKILPEQETKNPIIQTITNEIDEQKEIPIIDKNYENKEEWKEEIIATEKNTITQDNKLLLIDKLNFEIETQRLENEKIYYTNSILKEENNKYKIENTEIKEKNEYLEIQLKQTKNELEELQKNVLWEKTNLEKYLWTKLFETCRKNSNNFNCEQLFNKFYNE